MTNDAVADITESRQVNEQALFEQRGERTVQVGRFRESPKFLYEPRRVRGRTEKIWQHSEARSHFGREIVRYRARVIVHAKASVPCGMCCSAGCRTQQSDELLIDNAIAFAGSLLEPATIEHGDDSALITN